MNLSYAYKLNGVATGYPAGRTLRVVARGLSAELKTGRLTALVGANGVGKSTLLRTMAGFQPPLDGSLTLFDRPLKSYSARQLARQVAVVTAARPIVGGLTVAEVVALGRMPYTGLTGRLSAFDREAVDKALRRSGANHLADRDFGGLSDGERAKVMMARALAAETPVVLLDEPTAFLDLGAAAHIWTLLTDITRDGTHTVLLSTHDIEAALRLADQLWLLTPQGLSVGTPAQLIETGEVEKAFATPELAFDATARRFSMVMAAPTTPN